MTTSISIWKLWLLQMFILTSSQVFHSRAAVTSCFALPAPRTSYHFQHAASKKGQCTILRASAQLLHAPNTTIWSGEYLKIDVQSEVADTEIVLEPTNILRQWYHQCMSDNINTGTRFQVWFNSTRSPKMRAISCLQTSVLNFTTFNESLNLCSNQLSEVTMETLARYKLSRVSPT